MAYTKEQYAIDITNEKLRFENVKCPCCKSTNKKKEIILRDNITFGNNCNNSLFEYILCLDCGVLYKDLNVKIINYPDSNIWL